MRSGINIRLAYPLFDTVVDGHRAGVFNLDEAVAAANAVIGREDVDPAEALYVHLTIDDYVRESEDAELQNHFLKAAVKLSEGSDDPAVLKYRPRVLVDYALRVEGDKEKALALKREVLPEGWRDDAGQLNSFAWWCFENNVNLAEAEELARRGVELAEPGKQKASILDTVAEICNARGSCEDAVELTKLAIAENPDNDYYKSQLERFEEILAKAN